MIEMLHQEKRPSFFQPESNHLKFPKIKFVFKKATSVSYNWFDANKVYLNALTLQFENIK
jgi:hypothetical protein